MIVFTCLEDIPPFVPEQWKTLQRDKIECIVWFKDKSEKIKVIADFTDMYELNDVCSVIFKTDVP